MYRQPVGISVLTNGNRCEYLKFCIRSFLENCYYRPLVIGIFDNGSTDDTFNFLSSLPKTYGVTWKTAHSSEDLGCAAGTNHAHDLVRDCQYAIHLESDFSHMTETESGVNCMWLHDALAFMETGVCDYLYLRRMRNEQEMFMHWWHVWMPYCRQQEGPYVFCPGFWWSNNPALRRVEALYMCKTLPLNVSKDGRKGHANWSQPELQAPRPTKPWLYQWGMFTHERKGIEFPERIGCGKYCPHGSSSCKYGFYKPNDDAWCELCDHTKDFRDMEQHSKRFRK